MAENLPTPAPTVEAPNDWEAAHERIITGAVRRQIRRRRYTDDSMASAIVEVLSTEGYAVSGTAVLSAVETVIDDCHSIQDIVDAVMEAEVVL